MNDTSGLGLYRDLLLGVILPELHAIHETAVLEPKNDACQTLLHHDQVLCALQPRVETFVHAFIDDLRDDPPLLGPERLCQLEPLKPQCKGFSCVPRAHLENHATGLAPVLRFRAPNKPAPGIEPVIDSQS